METNKKIPKFMYELNILEKALKTWGEDSQINMTIEECNELGVALNHYRRGRASVDDVIKELVDVDIMIGQMLLLFDNGGLFYKKHNEVIKSLEERLNDKR